MLSHNALYKALRADYKPVAALNFNETPSGRMHIKCAAYFYISVILLQALAVSRLCFRLHPHSQWKGAVPLAN